MIVISIVCSFPKVVVGENFGGFVFNSALDFYKSDDYFKVQLNYTSKIRSCACNHRYGETAAW